MLSMLKRRGEKAVRPKSKLPRCTCPRSASACTQHGTGQLAVLDKSKLWKRSQDC